MRLIYAGNSLTQTTCNICIAHVAHVALAKHRAQRQRVNHGAYSVCSARSCHRARILADVLEARLPTGALRVAGALRLRLYDCRASCARIASISSRTHARSPMVVHTTLGALATLARIHASLVLACQIICAFGVAATFCPSATAEWITAIAVETVTRGSMIRIRPTFGVCTALDLRACVAAFAINARFRCRTI